MFELNKNPPINKGKIHKIIINLDDETVDIEYQVGYEEDGNFKSIGVNKLFLQDREEGTLEEGGEVIEEASTAHTDFITEFAAASKPETLALKILKAHGVKK